MSRPFRTRFALSLLAFTIGLSGCHTIYRPVYSNQRNYYQSPVAYNQKGQSALSAEEVLKSLPETGGYTPAAPDPNAMPPAPAAAPDMIPPAPGAPAPATPPPPQ
jgi:hypothetical protein